MTEEKDLKNKIEHKLEHSKQNPEEYVYGYDKLADTKDSYRIWFNCNCGSNKVYREIITNGTKEAVEAFARILQKKQNK